MLQQSYGVPRAKIDIIQEDDSVCWPHGLAFGPPTRQTPCCQLSVRDLQRRIYRSLWWLLTFAHSYMSLRGTTQSASHMSLFLERLLGKPQTICFLSVICDASPVSINKDGDPSFLSTCDADLWQSPGRLKTFTFLQRKPQLQHPICILL